MRFLTTLLLSGFITFSPAMAQDVVTLPEGQTALNISATETVEAEQDMLVASLRIQMEDKDAKTIQDTINKAMAKAVTEAKKYKGLKIETGQYYVHPDYRYEQNRETGENKQILDKWRGSQTLTIKSLNADDVLKVTGNIQDMGFVMNSLEYQLSPKKYEEIRDGLMETTIKSLNERAKRVATALGKANVDLVEINVDAQPMMPQPVYARGAKMEMMAMSADAMSAPVAEAGETSVSMTISARAIIKP